MLAKEAFDFEVHGLHWLLVDETA